jgi:Smg protein
MADRWTPVVEELRERFAADTDVVEVEAYLSSQGYDRRQIGEILSLLYSDTAVVPTWEGVITPRTVPLRVQGPHERGRFTSEAWGYLMMLGGSGAATLLEFEQLVERALTHVDGRIGIAEMRALAEEGGFDDAAPGGERTQVH